MIQWMSLIAHVIKYQFMCNVLDNFFSTVGAFWRTCNSLDEAARVAFRVWKLNARLRARCVYFLIRTLFLRAAHSLEIGQMAVVLAKEKA